jgi:hypothetical protein
VRPVSWGTLGPAARAFRVVHSAWSVAGLASLGYVWFCAVTGRRDRWLGGSVAFLLLEGAALIVGRGNCPMGQAQTAWGDPVPFFELVLPPRAAKAAIPILAAASLAGLGALALRARPVATVGACLAAFGRPTSTLPARPEDSPPTGRDRCTPP